MDAEAIVRELADSEPLTFDEDAYWCVLCQGEGELSKTVAHEPDCLWLAACAFIH